MSDPAPQEASIATVAALFGCAGLAAFAMLCIAEELGADSQSITLGVLLLTLVIYAGIGLVSRTAGDPAKLVAPPPSSPVMAGMAMAAGGVPVLTFAGLSGAAYALGFDGLAFMAGWAGGLALSAILISPYLAQSGARTLPDFFAMRFGALARVLAVVVLIVCSFPLLVAMLSEAAAVLSRDFALNDIAAHAVVAAVVLLPALLGGVRAVAWTQVAQYLVLVIAATGSLASLSYNLTGIPVPQLAYGTALPKIDNLELDMIEKGIANFMSLKTYAKPFTQFDELNFMALIVSLAAGTAALPHIASFAFSTAKARDARVTSAWAMLFLALMLTAVPAVATLVKWQVYETLARPTAFNDVPGWLKSRVVAGDAHIHGLSVPLVESVAQAAAGGAKDARDVSEWIAANAVPHAHEWQSLSLQGRDAVFAAARTLGVTASRADDTARWKVFVDQVLPAAAVADGNETGALTLTGVSMQPSAVVASVPAITMQPKAIAGAVKAGLLAACLAAGGALLMALARAFEHDVLCSNRTGGRSPRATAIILRLALTGMVALATAVAITTPGDDAALAALGFTFAASSLFPALVLGIWWSRINQWGALAGMLGGLAVAGYYVIGTQLFPVTFYDTWSDLSNAAPMAEKEFADLGAAWLGADGEARTAAWRALVLHASGTSVKPGIANWFGISAMNAAVFALPGGLLLTVLVSLVTPRPRREAIGVVTAMHEPSLPDADRRLTTF